MRNRVDKLGVAAPEIRKQGRDQIVIQLAGVHDADQAASIIGTDRPARALRPGARARAAVDRRVAAAGRVPDLYNLLSRVQATAKRHPSAVRALQAASRSSRRPAIGKNKKTQTTTTLRGKVARPAPRRSHRDPTTGNAGLLDPYHGSSRPAGSADGPARTVVISARGHAARLPGRPERRAGRRPDLLLPVQARRVPGDRYATNGKFPNMTGNELKLSGTRQDFDPTTGEPIVTLQFNGKGNKAFHAGHAERGDPRLDRRRLARSTSRSCSTTRSARARRSTTTQYPDGIDPTGGGAQITGIAQPQRGEEPRARAPDRRAAVNSCTRRAHRRLGDARQGLAEAGAQRGDRRPDRSSRSSCSCSTASSASSP